MSLKEEAIEAYEKEKELIKESNLREAEKFAEKALHSLRDIIGNEYGNMEIVVKQPGATSFSVDGILFRVTSSHGYNEISVVKKCPICETVDTVRILNIKDIGKALVEPHSKYDCDRMLEIKKESDDGKNGVILSTEARLLEAMRDFVMENGHMCSSD